VFLVSGARLGGEVEEKDPEAEDYSNIKVKRLPVVIVIVWY